MRLYDEKEIGAILKRTAELSKHELQPNADGLTLDELKELAGEAGLDPELVVRAASELSAGGHEQKPGFFGGPVSHSVDFEFDSEIDNETWERMLPVIRARFKDPGTVQTREGIFEWTGGTAESGGKAHVSVANAGGRSRLHVFSSFEGLAVLPYVPTILALFLVPIVLFTVMDLGWLGLPILPVLMSLIFMLSRLGVITMGRKVARDTDDLGRQLSRIVLEESDRPKVAQSVGVGPTMGEEIERSNVNAEEKTPAERRPSVALTDDEFSPGEEKDGNATPGRTAGKDSA